MNDLVFQFLRFAMVFKLNTIMMENVPGLAIDNRMERFRARLRDMGYKHRIKVVDAAEYGVPQRRRRMILIAQLHGRIRFARTVKRRSTVSTALAGLHSPEASTDPAHNYEVRRSPGVLEIIIA